MDRTNLSWPDQTNKQYEKIFKSLQRKDCATRFTEGKKHHLKQAFSGTKNTKVYIRFLNEKRNKKYSGSWLDFCQKFANFSLTIL